MRVLVIGGTQFIGAALARRLDNTGHSVAVFNRGKTLNDLPATIERITGDIARLGEARDAFAEFGPDVVVHNIIGTEKDAAVATSVFAGLAKRLVMTSSIDVYLAFGRLLGTEPGPRLPGPITEDSPLRTVLYPYRAQNPDPAEMMHNYDKIPAEQVVLMSAGLPGTVLRLPMVIGPRDHQRRLLNLVRPMHAGDATVTISEEFAGWVSTYDHVENVAVAMALAATDDRAAGRIYNVGDHPKSGLDLARAVKSALDWPGEIVIKGNAELPAADRFEAADHHPIAASAERIRTELGYEPLLDFEEAIRDTVAWDVANLDSTAGSWRTTRGE